MAPTLVEVILTEPSSGAGRGPQSIAIQRQREIGVQLEEKEDSLWTTLCSFYNLQVVHPNIKLNLHCFYTATAAENNITIEDMTIGKDKTNRGYGFMNERIKGKDSAHNNWNNGSLFNCLGYFISLHH